MTESILARAPRGAVYAATLGGLTILLATTIHHVYGAWLFDTPWRLHIVFISIPVAVAMVASVPLARRPGNTLAAHLASWTFILLNGGFAIALIGFYEGGYNHLLPNIQYALGIEHPLREGLYVPPDDLVFQLTGVAQFVVAAIAAWQLWRVIRPARNSRAPTTQRLA